MVEAERIGRQRRGFARAFAPGLLLALLATSVPAPGDPGRAEVPSGTASAVAGSSAAPAGRSRNGPSKTPVEGAGAASTGASGEVAWHRLLLVGDSIVANVPDGTWESGLPARLQASLPSRWVVWPYARGLWTVGLERYGPLRVGGRASPDPEALRALLVPGDAIAILLGTNDFRISRPIDDVRTEYGRLLDRVAQADTLSAPGPTLRVCVTPTWRKDADQANDLGLVLADYAAVIRDVCRKRGVAVVEGFELIRPGEAHLIDASPVHPTAAGNEVLGRRLGGKLEPLLARTPKAPRRSVAPAPAVSLRAPDASADPK